MSEPKKQIVPPFNRKDIECIAKGVYFNAFGSKKVAVKFGEDDIGTLQDFIGRCETYTVDDIGTKVQFTNILEGAVLEYVLVAIDHFDLANGKGKAHTTWLPTTILNRFTYLGLPWDTVDADNAYSTNKGGYPTALGLHEQEQAFFDSLPLALQRAIKPIEVPCYLPGYEITDAKYIAKIFTPSATEVGYSNETNQNVPENGDGTKFPYFIEGNSDDAIALRLTKGLDGEPSDYWLRTPYLSGPSYWYCVVDDGDVSDGVDTYECCGVAPAFCI